MKLYQINVTHYAPKDYHSSIQEYVVANNDREVFEYLANGYANWNEKLDYYDEGSLAYNEVLEELDEIYASHEDNREVDDLYYGATQYGWKEIEIKDFTKDLMLDLMISNEIVKDIRKYEEIEVQ